MRWIFLSCIFGLMLMSVLTKESDTNVLTRPEKEQVERSKRVSISDDVDFDHGEPQAKPKSRVKAQAAAGDQNASKYKFPVVLPAYGHEQNLPTAECMMYLENVTIVILDVASIKNKHTSYSVTVGGKDKDTYGYSPSYVNCPDYKQKQPVTEFSFTVDIDLADKSLANSSATGKGVFEVSGNVKFTLNFNESFGINLIGASIQSLKINVLAKDLITDDIDVTKAKPINAYSNSTNIRSYFQHNFACDSTQAIWFPNPVAGTEQRYHYLVGLVLNNVQIQSYNVTVANGTDFKLPYFSRMTTDCEPTFSPGSWMGLITTLVLVTVLMFGFLMLNSVQTMDRFDDPKQKQIVINFKE
uniref:V-type proton ATPase subunit S1/VOA1 transmembrane domain-containing protein n=1 Tax=Panagrolaimus sp. JU765 TaxID=591449 RepID=A0AC34RJ21_9BILA